MEVNINNIKRAMSETLKQWNFYWQMCDKNGYDTFICPKDLEFEEGDMVYVNLQVGYPHELAFAHWCYVVKDMGPKMLVIPAATPRGSRSEYEMDIINEIGVSRLQLSDIRTVDKQRIDKRKDPIRVLTPRKSIMRTLYDIIGW